jgi:hypothetical protein
LIIISSTLAAELSMGLKKRSTNPNHCAYD